MTDAPERIWASPEWRREDQGYWWDVNLGGDSEEYVRADKVAALVEACMAWGMHIAPEDATSADPFRDIRAALAAFKGDAQ